MQEEVIEKGKSQMTLARVAVSEPNVARRAWLWNLATADCWMMRHSQIRAKGLVEDGVKSPDVACSGFPGSRNGPNQDAAYEQRWRRRSVKIADVMAQ